MLKIYGRLVGVV